MTQLSLEDLLLDEDIKKYFELKEQIEQLTKVKDELNEKITTRLQELELNDYNNGEYSTKVVNNTKINYTDEPKLIELLKGDETLKGFVVEKVNTKALNDLIKKSTSVASKLQEVYTKNITTSLTVKKI